MKRVRGDFDLFNHEKLKRLKAKSEEYNVMCQDLHFTSYFRKDNDKDKDKSLEIYVEEAKKHSPSLSPGAVMLLWKKVCMTKNQGDIESAMEKFIRMLCNGIEFMDIMIKYAGNEWLYFLILEYKYSSWHSYMYEFITGCLQNDRHDLLKILPGRVPSYSVENVLYSEIVGRRDVLLWSLKNLLFLPQLVSEIVRCTFKNYGLPISAVCEFLNLYCEIKAIDIHPFIPSKKQVYFLEYIDELKNDSKIYNFQIGKKSLD
jgi:hypothetical protein